ncbi:hypothetical protein [Streptomyces sp. NPDC048473]|uniref:hypothetical protein n=1 Tax=unclassified Streptomyces TaxID=2593676 RepID=UPI003717890A
MADNAAAPASAGGSCPQCCGRGLALSTGLRLREFAYLLPWETLALPPEPTGVPSPFPVPADVTKGRKFRTTWMSCEALADQPSGAGVPGRSLAQ